MVWVWMGVCTTAIAIRSWVCGEGVREGQVIDIAHSNAGVVPVVCRGQ